MAHDSLARITRLDWLLFALRVDLRRGEADRAGARATEAVTEAEKLATFFGRFRAS